VRFTHLQSLDAIAGLTDDLDIGFRIEERFQTTPYNAMIVTEHYAQR
jgi:hypothetical protein